VVFSTNKNDHHDITAILLKATLNTTNQAKQTHFLEATDQQVTELSFLDHEIKSIS
jgi:hypothetical protein